MKSLYKSRTNKMVSGVCGGIGEYCCALGGSGVIAYVIAAILIPDAPEGEA